MAKVRRTDTTPERIVRKLLSTKGIRYRLDVGKLPGRPDIVVRSRRKVIFVHGCFWHGHDGCSRSGRPKTNALFWNKKIDSNILRDTRARQELEAQGWSVMVIWQCELKNLPRVSLSLERFFSTE